MNWESRSDDELVRLFKSGNREAFDAIVLRFQDRIFRLASLWLYDSQQAADASQEVFVRSFKGLRSFRFRATPFTWLYRTTRFVCNEFNRKGHPEPLEDEPVATDGSTEQQVADSQVFGQLRALVACLPERQREVVVLRLFEELSVRETAAAMGCREGTVKALLHKATARLRLDAKHTGLEHD